MIDTRFKKGLRELTERKARTFFTWCGLVVGLMGFGTVIVAYFWLSSDLNKNFLNTHPANIVVQTQDVNDTHRTLLSAVEGVAGVEQRMRFSGQIQIHENRWIQLVLFVIEDFDKLQVAKIAPESGAWPPPKGSLLLERSGQSFFGDRLRFAHEEPALPAHEKPFTTQVSLFAGQAQVAHISGLAFDAGMAPSPMEHMLYAYVTQATFLDWFPGKAEGRYLVRIEEDSQSTAAAWQVAWRIQERFKAAGIPEPWVFVPDAGQHPHQFQLNAILILFAGLAFLAFLLCAVLVVNLINAILAKQMRQIGVLKAIGGSRMQVMMIYLGSMVILGIATSAIAVPVAAKLGYALAKGVAGMLNFDLLTAALPWWFLWAMALLGVLLPVFVAWLPVRRAVSHSVQTALRSDGRGAQRTATLFQNGWPGPLSLGLAVRNNLRSPLRCGLTVMTLTVGLTFFLAALNVQSSLMQTVETVEQTKNYDLRIRLREPHSVAEVRKWGEAIPAIQGLEYWRSARIAAAWEAGRFGNAMPLLLVPENQRSLEPKILQGHWLNIAKPNGIVVNQKFLSAHPQWELKGHYPFKINDQVFNLEIIGVIKEFSGPAVYFSKEIFDKHFDSAGQTTLVMVRLDDHSFNAQADMRRLLQKEANSFGGKLGHVDLTQLMVLIVRRHLDIIAYVLGFVALVMLVVGALGMGSGMSVSTLERAREFGVMRAMGSSRGYVRKLLVLEATIMAVLAWGLALVLAEPVSRGISHYFGTLIVEYPFDYRHAFWGWVLALGVSLVIGMLASLLPTWRFLNGPVSSALRQD